MKFFVLSILICSIGYANPLELNSDSTGTLVIPSSITCDSLRIYIPGHAQELGFKGEVPNEQERQWAEYLIGPGNYNLGPAIRQSQCPLYILGDSNKIISSQKIDALLEKYNFNKIELYSHSGGYKGLDASLKIIRLGLKLKISKIIMLDNFYSKLLALHLRDHFDLKSLRNICSGFYTPHNRDRYETSYEEFCPNATSRGSEEHKSAVKFYL